MSIALACNVYQDAPALRGLLELGASYFDNIFIIHAGPGGAHSTDGTIELCEKFGATVVFDDIQKGFGVIRTRLIHECGCGWAFIMDADERFYPQMKAMVPDGDIDWKGPGDPTVPNITVTVKKDVIDQGDHVKSLISNPDVMAIRTTRRHWLDFTMRKPTMNWNRNQDHQLRIVRNLPEIGYVRRTVMHERLLDTRTGKDPNFAEQDPIGGPFHDHFHMAFRTAYPGHKEWNETNYARLSRGDKMIARE
jgi:hypothetical protein